MGDGQSHLGGLHMARVFNGQSNVLRRAERLEQGGVRAAAREVAGLAAAHGTEGLRAAGM